jgi:hypothetical protein
VRQLGSSAFRGGVSERGPSLAGMRTENELVHLYPIR